MANLVEKITLSNTMNDEVIVLKHFYTRTEEENILKEFSDKDIYVYFDQVFPDDWESLTYQEKVLLSSKHIFPCFVHDVYINKEYQATYEDAEN